MFLLVWILKIINTKKTTIAPDNVNEFAEILTKSNCQKCYQFVIVEGATNNIFLFLYIIDNNYCSVYLSQMMNVGLLNFGRSALRLKLFLYTPKKRNRKPFVNANWLVQNVNLSKY